MSRSSSRMPGASISRNTAGCGPPRSGWTKKVSIAPSAVARSKVRSIMRRSSRSGSVACRRGGCTGGRRDRPGGPGEGPPVVAPSERFERRRRVVYAVATNAPSHPPAADRPVALPTRACAGDGGSARARFVAEPAAGGPRAEAAGAQAGPGRARAPGQDNAGDCHVLAPRGPGSGPRSGPRRACRAARRRGRFGPARAGQRGRRGGGGRCFRPVDQPRPICPRPVRSRPIRPRSCAPAGRPVCSPVCCPAAPSAPPPPPPAALAGPSPGAAVALPAPLTLSFPAGKATLTPAETEAIARLVRAAPQTDSTSFSVLAYAAGSPQNPSAARRLALARALAVHDALRAAGVPGSRIFLRAMGPPDGSGAPDRAELRVSAAAGTKS